MFDRRFLKILLFVETFNRRLLFSKFRDYNEPNNESKSNPWSDPNLRPLRLSLGSGSGLLVQLDVQYEIL